MMMMVVVVVMMMMMMMMMMMIASNAHVASVQDLDGNGEIDRFEFTIYLLKLWGIVDDVILDQITGRFEVRPRGWCGPAVGP
jgi:hypothetical protein